MITDYDYDVSCKWEATQPPTLSGACNE